MDAGVEVVYLGVRVNLTFEEIQSGEREGAVLTPTIDADVLAGHEPHVRVERQPVRGLRPRFPGVACALDLGRTHESVEVRDGRDLVAEDRELDVEWGAGEDDSRDRPRIGDGFVPQHRRPDAGG